MQQQTDDDKEYTGPRKPGLCGVTCRANATVQCPLLCSQTHGPPAGDVRPGALMGGVLWVLGGGQRKETSSLLPCSRPLQGAEPAQPGLSGLGSEPNSRVGRVRVTPLGQKGSLGGGACCYWQLLCSASGKTAGLSHPVALVRGQALRPGCPTARWGDGPVFRPGSGLWGTWISSVHSLLS